MKLKLCCISSNNQDYLIWYLLRWDPISPGHITVSGFSADVKGVMDFMKQKCDFIEKSLTLPVQEFRSVFVKKKKNSG